jgi:hypothetical protein
MLCTMQELSVRSVEAFYDQTHNADRVQDALACLYCLSESVIKLRAKYQDVVAQKHLMAKMMRGYVGMMLCVSYVFCGF